MHSIVACLPCEAAWWGWLVLLPGPLLAAGFTEPRAGRPMPDVGVEVKLKVGRAAEVPAVLPAG